MSRNKTLLVSGLAALFTFGGLAGCGDGVDQDNGISDGEQKDQLDIGTKNDIKWKINDAKKNIKEGLNNVEKKLDEEL
ncbi:hypothetical protein ACIFOT_26270 [Neobacillus sp. NRS-1170]|uniref:hypothetical protein n=1 Tax=Neobacillus sp. NRS-1170 TaxID=3233898 RepID=UPI003D2C494C